MNLSIVIVNYKSTNLILDCLESAKAYDSFYDFEWIIVDNQSNDNGKSNILNKYPNVIWIDMGFNAGFAIANNKGMKEASGDIILLLNPDTIILDDAIKKCLTKFIQSDHLACGVQLLNKDLTHQISGSNFMKGGINHLLPLPYIGNMLKFLASIAKIEKPSIEKASTEEKVEWISGAFLMVKKKAIQEAGYMDEDFFLYAEEVEWCNRISKKGSLCIYGNINIIHLVGETITVASKSNDKSYTNIFDKKGGQLILSNHVRIRKQYGVAWFFFQLIIYTLSVPIFYILSILEHLMKFENPFKEFNLATGLAKNVVLIWKHVNKIVQNKPHFYKVL